MRKTKTLTISGKDVTVKEMTASDILKYAEIVESEMTNPQTTPEAILKGLLCDGAQYVGLVSACTDSETPVTEWGISAYGEVLAAFQEVNSDFFAKSGEALTAFTAQMAQIQQQ